MFITLQLDYMPKKGEALIINSMPAMAQFVFDLYNTKLEEMKSSMPVSISYIIMISYSAKLCRDS